MSFAEDLLIILTSYSGGYKLMRQKLYGGQNFSYQKKLSYQEIKDQTLRRTLSRLKKCDLVENKNHIWKITHRGKAYLKNKLASKIPHFGHLKTKNASKNMIVIFDIPETRKKQRSWLRFDLAALGFIPLQKSVWFGPSPLPKEFIKYLNETNILQYLKFFKADEKDIIGSD